MDRVIDRVDKKLITKLPKMEVVYTFPNLYPGTRTVIVLKQPKTEGNIRTAYLPDTVVEKLTALKQMQEKLKMELGPDGYMDYGLVICQANGRPIMTEHLNKQFKEVLAEMDDLDIDAGRWRLEHSRHGYKAIRTYPGREPQADCRKAGLRILWQDKKKRAARERIRRDADSPEARSGKPGAANIIPPDHPVC